MKRAQIEAQPPGRPSATSAPVLLCFYGGVFIGFAPVPNFFARTYLWGEMNDSGCGVCSVRCPPTPPWPPTTTCGARALRRDPDPAVHRRTGIGFGCTISAVTGIMSTACAALFHRVSVVLSILSTPVLCELHLHITYFLSPASFSRGPCTHPLVIPSCFLLRVASTLYILARFAHTNSGDVF